MIKLSDYVIDFLVKKGIHDIFLVSGGGIMHLCDSVGRNNQMSYISNHHEQASAMSAEVYARVKNHIGACLVTTGPGGTNALTGVAGAFVDSIPMVVLSGQVRTQVMADYKKLRQLGPQELNVVFMAQPITKYATTVMDPRMIKYELEKAFNIALSGRPGPVWIDLPLDVQGSMIEEDELVSYIPEIQQSNKNLLKVAVKKTIKMLQKSKRPVLILGYGIRLSGAVNLLDTFIKKINAPILVHYNGMDLIEENHPLFIGKFGPVGQRRGNFALQNSDILLSVGAGLTIAAIGFDFKNFAPKAKKVVVNIDKEELTKPTFKIDIPILADAKDFMTEFLQQTKKISFHSSDKWHVVCNHWKKKYPSIMPSFFKDKKYVNTYVFFDVLSDIVVSKDIVVTGNSLDAVCLFQAFKVKKGQRVFTNANLGAMGYCIPASIGACIANNRKRIILITGDGSIQFNIQELETIKDYKLPIKIFIINNQGYESIRTTQTTYFNKRFVGSDLNSGVGNPDFKKLAEAYGFHYEKIHNNNQIQDFIKKVLAKDGPVICELNVSPNQHREPKSASFRRKDGTLESRPLEDMYPFLPRQELWENMHMFDKIKSKK